MALFDPPRRPDDEEIIGSDAATRALSVTAVENDFVDERLRELASVYDFTFGPTLHPGRCRRFSGWASSPAIACSRSASAPASTPRSIRATAR